MVSLTVLCEGATEQKFIATTLAPHLKMRDVFAKPINLGGTPTLAALHKQIDSALRSRRSHEYVTTMLDLYRLGNLPGNDRRSGESMRERISRIEHSLLEAFPNPNFIPYIQLHEFESLVLVDVDKIPMAFPDGEADNKITSLKKSIGDTEPELVNEQPDSAPSKRIIGAIPAYRSVKASVGAEIVEAIGLPRLREACPNFNAWVTRLECLT